jgi:hypothetical protein
MIFETNYGAAGSIEMTAMSFGLRYPEIEHDQYGD